MLNVKTLLYNVCLCLTARKKQASERTIEVNTLSDLAFIVRQQFGTQITVYSPSLREERDLGFDDYIHGLPMGKNLVFQFKRPKSYESSTYVNSVRFEIDTRQFQILLDMFRPGEAFYVFVALNTFEEIVTNRQNLLNYAVCCDVHDIPAGTSFQKSRVARMIKSFIIPPPRVEIADRRKFRNIQNLTSLEELCQQAILCRKGMTNDRIVEVLRPSADKEYRDEVGAAANWKHTYFVHIKSNSVMSALWPDS